MTADPAKLSAVELLNTNVAIMGGWYCNAYLKIDGKRIKLGRGPVRTLDEAVFILGHRTKNRITLAPRVLKQINATLFICEKIGLDNT